MADDHYSSKRKYDDPSPPPRRTGFSSAPPAASPPSGGAPASYNSVPPPPADEIQLAKQRAQAIAARLFNAAEAKRPRLDAGGDDDDAGAGVGSLGSSGGGGGGRATGLGFSSSAGGGHGSAIPSLSSHGSTPQYSSYGGYQGTSKTIEIPNGRVGVIIGKSGETIKNLQLQSGAKIQVTRDLDALPGSQTRPVELSGTPDQISRAEQLINEVLAEVILLRSWLSFYHFRDDLTLAEHLVRWPYLLFM
jgi:far upstream element-binding protein